MTTKPIHFPGKKMIAHRGVSGLETENTCAAFVAAGNRSYYGIETDVHVTKDGKFIVIHDDNTERVCGVSHIVEETDYDTLRALTLYDKGTEAYRHDLRLPSLEEYARICLRYEKVAILELKNPMTKEAIAGIVDTLRAQNALENTTFISFSYQNLVYVRECAPNAVVQFLCGKMTEECFADMVKDRFDLDIHHSGVTEELVRNFHNEGLKINVWTVDDPDDVERLLKMGVDFITSNICE